MKKTSQLLSTAALVIFSICAAFSIASCGSDSDNNDDDSEDQPSIAAIKGTHTGKVLFVNDSIGAVNVTATDNEIKIASFPYVGIMSQFMDPATVATIVPLIGDLTYEFGYSTQAQGENFLVQLTTQPLAITLPMGSIEIEIEAPEDGLYTTQTKNLQFALTINKITMLGNDTEFPPITLNFDLNKQD